MDSKWYVVFDVDRVLWHFQFHWMDSYIHVGILTVKCLVLADFQFHWMDSRGWHSRPLHRVILSIPLNGFSGYTVGVTIDWLAVFLSIPLNGFLQRLLPEGSLRPSYPFNSIEWIPDLEPLVGSSHPRASFNSIEWIQSIRRRWLEQLAVLFQFHWMDSKRRVYPAW